MIQLNYLAPINQDNMNAFMSSSPNTADSLLINFSSSGGDVDVAFRMYEYLRMRGYPIIMRNTGDVSSSAIIPFLAADTRQATKYCVFRIHRLTTAFQIEQSFNDLNSRMMN